MSVAPSVIWLLHNNARKCLSHTGNNYVKLLLLKVVLQATESQGVYHALLAYFGTDWLMFCLFFYKHWHDVISHVLLLISDCIYLILTPGISCQAKLNWTEDVLPFYYDCVYKAKQQRRQAFASYNKGFNSHTHQSSIGIKWPIKHDIAALRPCNLPISMCSESVDFKLHTCFFLNCVDRPTETRLLLSKYSHHFWHRKNG